MFPYFINSRMYVHFVTYMLKTFRTTVIGYRVSYSVVSDSVQPHGLQAARFLSPWNSPGKNTGVGQSFPVVCICFSNLKLHFLVFTKKYKIFNPERCMHYHFSVLFIFIPALFAITKIRKQPKCPWTDELIKKTQYLCTMESTQKLKKPANLVI